MAALGFSILAGSAFAQSADPKTNFVQTLGQFSLALDAPYGDEGPRILAHLDTLARATAQWDDAIREYESEARKNPPSDAKLAALMHVALGGLYLDRTRVVDAKREFDAAVALDSSRPDTFMLQGLASSAGGDYGAAVASYRKALELDPPDTARAYAYARALARAGQTADASRVFSLVAENQKKQSADRLVAVSARFMRFGLVEERSGVEPFFPPAIYSDAFARLVRGDLAAALSALRDAARKDVVVSGVVNQSYAMRKAADALRSGDIQAALVQLQAAIELYPDASEPQRLLGGVYAADEQYDRAIAALQKAVTLAPDEERSRLALADVFVRVDQPAAAERTLRETIARIPASGRAHYSLARILQSEGRPLDAIEELQRSLTFTPLLGVNGIYQKIGAMTAALQRFDESVDSYSRRVEIQPNDAGAHQDLGDAYARLGRDAEALAEFSVALLLDPARVAAFAAIAQVHLRTGKYEDAALVARRAVDLDPAHAQARYALATALLRVGKAEEGQRELEIFQRLQAEAASARARDLELGRLRREASVSSAAGDHANAIALLRRALEIAPDEMVSHLNLGIALMLAGRPAEAVERFTSALALHGPDEIHQRLAQAYAAMGRAEDSRREIALFEQVKQMRLQQAGADR